MPAYRSLSVSRSIPLSAMPLITAALTCAHACAELETALSWSVSGADAHNDRGDAEITVTIPVRLLTAARKKKEKKDKP
eukprot:2975604-Rhodomonas_salina.1